MAPPAKRRRASLTRTINISPIKIVTDNGHLQSASQPSETYASYMSPTRASLARLTPDLVRGTRTSLGLDGLEEDQIFDVKNAGKEKRRTPQRLNPTPLRNTTSNRGSAPPALASPERATGPGSGLGSKTTQFLANGNGLASNRSAHTKVGKPNISPENEEPGLRLDPASQAEQNGNLEMSLPGSILQEQDERTGELHLPQTEDGEPELPILPSFQSSGQPRGLLSSSPSGRASRRLASRRSMQGSSPLKPTAKPPEVPDTGQEEVQPSGQERHETTQGLTPEHLFAPEPSGPIVAHDLELQRKQDELGSLLRERSSLQEDVDLLGQVVSQPEIVTSKAPSILNLLVSDAQPGGRVAMLGRKHDLEGTLSLFLPFAPRRPSKDTIPDSAKATALKNQPSFQGPTSLLRPFMPLKLTSNVTIVPETIRQEHLHQKHSITFASPDQLLQVQLDLIVDTFDDHVLATRKKYISSWAVAELGEFIDQQVEADKVDIKAIGSACAKYWEMANLRAATWTSCREDHGDLVVEMTRPLSSDEPEPAIDKPERLGQPALQLQKDGIALLFLWKIGFEPTGDVQSYVSASAAFPALWRDTDKYNMLDRVDDLFDLLVRRKGVRAAIQILVELVFERND